jgi:1,5-anhydro-D-fructose reductase (1,5-anhydro-D-mannitol-forming)
MLNVALLSRWHPHASGYGRDFSSRSDVKVTVVWDEVPQRGKAWAEELGCEFEADYDKVLARADVDAICCTAPTSMHKELFIKAAAAKKHIFTEKVLAATKQEALEIKEAVEAAGIKFCISFPMRTQPHILFAKKLIEDGTLGTINYLRVRNAHNGISGGWLPEHFKDPVTCGGGAMMDLGAHPMYLCSFLLGKPVKVSSTFNKLYDTPVDDNCVSVIEFENKVIAVSETGFVTDSSPFSLELSGTRGTFIVGGPDGKAWLKSSEKPSPFGGWMVPNLPKALPSAISQFVDAVLNDGEIIFGMDDAIALSELMDGAYRSYHEDRVVYFNEF